MYWKRNQRSRVEPHFVMLTRVRFGSKPADRYKQARIFSTTLYIIFYKWNFVRNRKRVRFDTFQIIGERTCSHTCAKIMTFAMSSPFAIVFIPEHHLVDPVLFFGVNALSLPYRKTTTIFATNLFVASKYKKKKSCIKSNLRWQVRANER